MRVTDGSGRGQEAAAGGRSRRFGEAMRRAREEGAGEARGAAAREAGARASSARRTFSGAKEGVLATRREGAREEERTPGAPTSSLATATPPPASCVPALAGPAELRAILRALPVAVDASRIGEGAPLSLSLGRALDVDLRAAAAGVEVVLRPDPRLARAAQAELPSLVASLRSRGITVARAEVRARARGEAAGRRVDVSSPLR